MTTFEEALDAYYDHFGVQYPFAMGFGYPAKTPEENIAIIERCIRENKPVVFEPKYDPDCDY